MSTSYRLCFAVGVPVSRLLDGESYQRSVPRTKYHEDTGAPYQVPDNRWYIKLRNGAELEQRMFGSYPIEKTLAPHDIQVTGDGFDAIAGLTLTEGSFANGNPACSMELPTVRAEDAKRAYDLLTKAGFPISASDIKVYAVLDVSY